MLVSAKQYGHRIRYAFYIPLALQDNDELRDKMAKMQDALAALNLSKKGKGPEETTKTTVRPSPSLTKPHKKTPNPKSKAASKTSKSKSADDDDDEDSAPDDASGDDDDDDEFLSEAAKKQRLRRVCQRSSLGKLKVPENIHEMWLKGGHTRDELCKILEESGWDQDPFISFFDVNSIDI